MYVDRPLVDVHVTAPYLVEQLLAREDSARSLHQKLKQPKFSRTEMNLAIPTYDPVAVAIERDVGSAKNSGNAQWLCAMQKRTHPGEKLRHRKRLNNIVVRPCGESTHAIYFFSPSCQHDDRYPLRLGADVQPPAQLDSRNPRQQPVENDEIG